MAVPVSQIQMGDLRVSGATPSSRAMPGGGCCGSQDGTAGVRRRRCAGGAARSGGFEVQDPQGPGFEGQEAQLRRAVEATDRLLHVLTDLAEAEPNPVRREFLQSFPFAGGLLEDEAG